MIVIRVGGETQSDAEEENYPQFSASERQPLLANGSYLQGDCNVLHFKGFLCFKLKIMLMFNS